MRVILIAIGSRGDIEPYCSLTKELLLLQNHKNNHNNNNNNNADSEDDDDHHHHHHCHTIDFIVQSNWYSLVQNSFLNNNNPKTKIATTMIIKKYLRIHTLPFTNQDYYRVQQQQQKQQQQKQKQQNIHNHNDPRMKSVEIYSNIIRLLVLPCWKQISNIIVAVDNENNDHRSSNSTNNNKTVLITSNSFARQLGIIISKIHNIPLVLLNLQPSVPNRYYPNYRVSVNNFINAIIKIINMNFNNNNDKKKNDHDNDNNFDPDHDNNNNDDYDYEETYWRIEYALEEYFLKDDILKIYKEATTAIATDTATTGGGGNSSSSSSSNIIEPYTWDELQNILKGGRGGYSRRQQQQQQSSSNSSSSNPIIKIVTAYSNHLIPDNNDNNNNNIPNNNIVVNVGPLADSYLPFSFDESTQKYYDELLHKEFGASDEKKPICIGFGSMGFSNYPILIEAMKQLNKRAILVGGGNSSRSSSSEESSSDSYHHHHHHPSSSSSSRNNWLYYLPNTIPYPYLLRKCSMMLCHGGAGVVNACIKAGIPCWICPTMGDQFAYGKLVEIHGVGVQCCTNLQSLNVEDIISTYPKALDCQQNCQQLALKIRRQQQEQQQDLHTTSSGPKKLIQLLEEIAETTTTTTTTTTTATTTTQSI